MAFKPFLYVTVYGLNLYYIYMFECEMYPFCMYKCLQTIQIAYETMVNIRTVASLTLEKKLGDLFEEKVKEPFK